MIFQYLAAALGMIGAAAFVFWLSLSLIVQSISYAKSELGWFKGHK